MAELPRSNGRGFSMRAEAGRAEVLLYDVIDPWYGISAKQFHADLKALGEVTTIDLRINSPGGSVTEGMAIYSILKRQEARVIAHVDGIAASMASVVAMAANEIVMAQGAYLMIHNPLGVVVGEADEMREYADLLDKTKAQLVAIYAKRTNRPAEDIARLMDEETWFTPDEAIAAGFADRSTADLAIAASIDASRFTNLPQKLRGQASMTQPTHEQKTPDQIRSELLAANQDYATRFGPELAAKWGPLGENKPLLECYAEFVAQLRTSHEAALGAKDAAHATAVAELQTKLADAEKKAADAEARLASLNLGEREPVSGGAAAPTLPTELQASLTPAMAKYVTAQRAAKEKSK